MTPFVACIDCGRPEVCDRLGECNLLVPPRLTPFVADTDFTLYQGDVREVLAALPDGSVDCCVTSPPYFGLRDYGTDGQIGLEETVGEYVAAMVAVFSQVRRVLTDTATCWLNLGDSYAANRSYQVSQTRNPNHDFGASNATSVPDGLKPKDLIGIPWRVAFALQADGWWLRRDIIWAKPNPMPESVTDRPTTAHEYLFLLTKSPRYFYAAEAIAEPARWYGPNGQPKSGPHAGQMKGRAGKGHTPASWEERKAAGGGSGNVGRSENYQGGVHGVGVSHELGNGLTRNARSVWTIQTMQYADAHFATFPEELPRRCILAGCPVGGTVLDPFMGSGTTAKVARDHGRKAIGVELNPDYAALCARRLQQLSLLAGEPAA